VFRDIIAFMLGIVTATSIWFAILYSGYSPKLQATGLLHPIMSGLLGGFVATLVNPRNPIFLATLAGVFVAIPLLAFLLRHGFSHDSRNPLLWYWPIYLVPAFAGGGLLCVVTRDKLKASRLSKL